MKKRLAWLWVAVMAGGCGGSPAPSDAGDAGVDAPVDLLTNDVDPIDEVDDVDVAPKAADVVDVAPVTDRATEPRCDKSAHVDCFGGSSCRDGTVAVCAFAPYPTCSAEGTARALAADICCRDGRSACPSGRCAAPDPRFAACLARYHRGSSVDARITDAHCEGGLRQEGDPCTSERGCSPAADAPDLALRCDADAGRCVRMPRPAAPPGFGDPCGLGGDDNDVVVRTAGCAACVVRTQGCSVSRCSLPCIFDEQCPAGWDCRVSNDCTGVCVPRGQRAAPHLIPCDDAGAPADATTDA